MRQRADRVIHGKQQSPEMQPGRRKLRLQRARELQMCPGVRKLIQRGEIGTIKEAMEQSAQEGSQTFDMALYELYAAGRIDLEQALMYADSVNNLLLVGFFPGVNVAEAMPYRI